MVFVGAAFLGLFFACPFIGVLVRAFLINSLLPINKSLGKQKGLDDTFMDITTNKRYIENKARVNQATAAQVCKPTPLFQMPNIKSMIFDTTDFAGEAMAEGRLLLPF